jgi:hypothetical protein
VTVNQAVFAVLNASIAVKTLLGVGSPVVVMIYPGAVQSEVVPPYVVFRVTDDEDMRAIDGSAPTTSAATVEFYCYGKTAAEAAAVFDAVSGAIIPYRDATWWQGTIHLGVVSDYIAELQTYTVTFTAKIWHFNN